MKRLAFIGSAALAVIVVVAIALMAGSGSSDDDPTALSAVTTQPDGGAADGSTTTTADGSGTVATTAPGSTIPNTASTAPEGTSRTTGTTSGSTGTTPTTTASGSSTGRPPTVSITAPGHLSRHQATYRESIDAFAATVSFSASATDPEGGPVTLQWFAGGGAIGSGSSISATIRTNTDVSQPVITVRATDRDGNVAQDAVQIIVWILSDQ